MRLASRRGWKRCRAADRREIGGIKAWVAARAVEGLMGQIAEFIDDGVTGVLVPEADPPALADALALFLINAERRQDVARRARAEALRRFDARTNIRSVEKRILEACGYAG